ncbi:MAG: DUF523 domain-containing protein [Endomicrobiia bacterium]
MKEKILVSACLCRKKCRYDGKILNSDFEKIIGKSYKLITVCPEKNGGLLTPRSKSFITGSGKGKDVLEGKEKVINIEGKDVTKNFLRGAKKALQIALKNKIKKAFLKSKSPSCGEKGVASALLKMSGIKIKWVD